VGLSIEDERKIGFLLQLVRPDQSERVRARLGALGGAASASAAEGRPTGLQAGIQAGFQAAARPVAGARSAALWRLQCDQPELNVGLFGFRELGDAVRRDLSG
jgi:hypothetical protein